MIILGRRLTQISRMSGFSRKYSLRLVLSKSICGICVHLRPIQIRMKSLFIIIALLLLFGTAQGAGVEGKERVAPKIAPPPEVAGYKWDGKIKTFNSKTVFEYINGAAELYLAYGFLGLKVWRFEKTGAPPINLEIYEQASSEDAYGVFSYEQQDEPAGIGQGSEFGGGLLRFWKGNYFVSVYAEGEGKDVEAAILDIGKAAAQAIPITGPEPKLIQSLPGKEFGQVERSVRFLRSHVLLNQRFFIAHQNILNLGRKTEAVLAVYLRGGQKVQLLLIRYPDADEAGNSLESFRKAYMPDAGGKDRVKTEDRKWAFARQQKDYLLLVFSAPTESDAESLLKATEERLIIGRR